MQIVTSPYCSWICAHSVGTVMGEEDSRIGVVLSIHAGAEA